MSTNTVDLDRIATYLKSKMASEGISTRAAAKEIKIGASTLTRLLQGNSNENVPDLAVIDKAAKWVGKSLADLADKKKLNLSTIADVEVHLRALPGLSATDIEGLVGMVRAGYDHAKKLRAEKRPQRPRTSPSES